MKVLLLDNFDSFTYNLYQAVGQLFLQQGVALDIEVKRNDEWTLDQIRSFAPERILISPGPGRPSEKQYFGVCRQVLEQLSPKIPTLGICLGMQGIAEAFGGKVVLANEIFHGKTSNIIHDGKGIYQDMPQFLEVMRYHSLAVDDLGDELEITAFDQDYDKSLEDQGFEQAFANGGFEGKTIMSLRHRNYPICGLQYHIESFATEGGLRILGNFLFHSWI